MPSEKILAAKKQVVEDLVAAYKDAATFVFVSARGLTVEQDTAMRAELRKNGVKYQVVKNTTLRLVFKELGIEGLDEIVALSKVPDKETLYSQVVYGLLFPFTKLAMLVKAVAEKAQEEGGEVAAAPAEAAAPVEG